MTEADFQVKFSKWLINRYRNETGNLSGAFELKLCKGKSLPFSAVKDHQKHALNVVRKRAMSYKISDDSFGQKPFDCFFMSEQPAYVVVMFYRRGQKEFIMIDVDIWLMEELRSERKSLTEERAKQIGISFCLPAGI